MPNTLAHLGVQGILTRALLRDADFKWIYLGCILPDIPWILRRFVTVTLPTFDAYDLHLYATVQASQLFCLLLSFSLAMLSTNFKRNFAILGINSFLHLLLDASQTKWGNGVHFLAPFDWQLTNFGLFWPESFITYLLTGFGLVYFIWSWIVTTKTPGYGKWQPSRRLFEVSVILIAYFTTPILLFNGPTKEDNHFIKTLRSRQERAGLYLELDRAAYEHHASAGILRTFAKEELNVDNMPLYRSVEVSIRGTFASQYRIRVKEYHVHTPLIRYTASFLGLGLVTLLWVDVVKRKLATAK